MLAVPNDTPGPSVGPPISVFVPSYNHELFIEACLRSIFAQTYPPTLLLVIDDGSSDNSPWIIDRVLEDCPFPARFIARPNKGLGATLNEALSRSSGPLVAYLGSDDRWHPDRLKEAVGVLEANPRSVATFGECYLIDQRDRTLNATVFVSIEGRRRWPWSGQLPPPIINLETLLRFRSVPLSPTVTYRREAVERFGWNESSPTEDYEMYLMLASIGEFAYIERPLGYWRLHAWNASRQLETMLEATLGAQQRVAVRLGLSREALCRYQACVRYSYGEYFLRAGQWRRGASLTIRNITGAPASASAVGERLARLAVPSALVDALRRIRKP